MSAPVVFAGPSVSAAHVLAALPGARVEPPAGRGDLGRMLDDGHGTLLILDGAFAHRLAVAPSEIVRAIRAGARVLGAASLGAVRASECWPAGMEGSGAVYRLFRLRVLSSDDEVAVSTDPERAFAALSVSLIDVRYAALAARRRGLLDAPQVTALVEVARRTHFAERRWPALLAQARMEGHPDLRALCEATDVKGADAREALRRLSLSSPHAERRMQALEPSGPRMPGHAGLLGRSVTDLRDPFGRWMQANGRARRYGASGDALWALLERTGALEGELLRWHASTGPEAAHIDQ